MSEKSQSSVAEATSTNYFKQAQQALESANNSPCVFRNPSSIESLTAPSPAGSLIEQFDSTATPQSADDAASDTSINIETSNSSNQAFSQQGSNNTSKLSFDPNSSSFKFRRHSSQSSLNLPLNLQINNPNSNGNATVSPLTIAGNNTATNNFTSTDRVCSSPINNLKMSSRVCQIKIDEGIEPHLSREIKSERETQNTLKLKTSCDELMINNDDLGLDSFSFDPSQNRNTTNSPSFLNTSNTNGSSATFRRYRTFSESLNNTISNINQHQQQTGNMPSPSISSCQSYSNSSSPTGFLNQSNLPNSGLLRCFSPSTTLTINNQNLNQSQLNQNYFSQSPSPTRKLFVTRRSMSPIPCSLRPSSLNTSSNLNQSNKRKISDVESSDMGNSLTSSCHSPKRSYIDSQQEFVQPLLIFTGNNPNVSRVISNRSTASSPSPSVTTPSSPGPCSLVITAKTKQKSDEDGNSKYTFVPIQLPPPSSSPGLVNSMQQLQHKRLSFLASSSTSTNSQTNNLPNSPSSYSCDSPISCSPSVSNISSSINGDKPDSGYQSSAQISNNSDSESCT